MDEQHEIYAMGEHIQTKVKRRGPELNGERLERFRRVRRKMADVENRDLTDRGLLDEVVTAFITAQEKRFGIKTDNYENDSVPNV